MTRNDTEPSLVPDGGYTLVVEDITDEMASADPTLDINLESYYRYKWSNLDGYDGTGVKYYYYAAEPVVPDWYVADYGHNAVTWPEAGTKQYVLSGDPITNRYTPPNVEIQVEKRWINGPKPYPQAVDVVLMRSYQALDQNGDTIDVVEPGRQHLIERSGSGTEAEPYVWQLNFDSLPASDFYGRTYNYYAIEGTLEAGQVVEAPPEHYKVSDQTDGYNDVAGRFETTITNTYDPPVGPITATKEWHVDEASALLYPDAYRMARQDIWMQLYRTIDANASPVLVADSRQGLPADAAVLTLTWPNMPLKDNDGVDYIYSVKEVGPNGEEGWSPINFLQKPDPDADPYKVHNHFLTADERDGQLTITKHLLDASGNPYGEGTVAYPDPLAREFTVIVTGPYGYRREAVLKAGESKVFEHLAHGDYTIIEDDIDPALYETALYSPASRTVSLAVDQNEGTLSVTNQEKRIGQLTLYKLIEDYQGILLKNKLFPDEPGEVEVDEREFTFKVTGPVYPWDTAETLAEKSREVTVWSNSDAGTQLTELTLGTYRISEVDTDVLGKKVSDLYDMPAYPQGQDYIEVTLTVRHPVDEVTLINREKKAGEITLHKYLLDADGNPMADDGRTFTVLVDGEQLTDSIIRDISRYAAEPVTITGLPFGEYIVLELDDTGAYTTGYSLLEDGTPAGDYAAVILTLEPGMHEKYQQAVYITNQEQTIGQLTLSKQVINTLGEPGASNPEPAEFEVLLTGPGEYAQGTVIKLPAKGDEIILSGLPLGTYTVEELPADGYKLDDYIVTNPKPIVLGYNADTRETELFGKATVKNTEKPLAKLTIEKVLKDALGNVITQEEDDRRFVITVFGPMLGESGTRMTLPGGSARTLPLQGEGMVYGTYSVTEEDYSSDYYTHITPAVTLHPLNKHGHIIITNTEKPLGVLTSTLMVYDAQGNPVPDARVFDAIVTGPAYEQGGRAVALTHDVQWERTGLAYGEYAITLAELAELEKDYIIDIGPAVSLSMADKNGHVDITLTERRLGKLTVSAQVNDLNGNPVPDGQKVIVTVFGPSFPQEGQQVEITTGQPFPEFDGLIYGDYRVEADDPNYDITLPEPVTLSITNKTGTLDTIFQERPIGSLTVSAQVLDVHGKPVPDGRKVSVTVYGPSYPEGKVVEIITGQPFPVLKDLKYGEYRIEVKDTAYAVTLPKPVTLTRDHREDALHAVLREQANGALTISAQVLDASGSPVPNGHQVTVTVYGPSFPNGKQVTITTGKPFPVLDGLAYGEYRLEANDPAYTIKLPNPITLSYAKPTGGLEAIFQEQAACQLTLGVQVFDADGRQVYPNVLFSVVLYGPSYPNGQAFLIKPGLGNSILVDGLMQGTYHVVLENAGMYRVRLPKAVTLLPDSPTGELIIKLHLPGPGTPIPSAPVQFNVGNTVE